MKIDQEYELVQLDGDVDVLKPHPKNPNQGDDEIVAESIDVNGWYGAITAQKSTGYILAGHTRWRTAIRKGAKEIPVIWKDVDDDTALKILLADNQTARRAEMDESRLEEALASLDTLDGTGFMFASAQERIESTAPEPEPEPEDDGGEDEVPDDQHVPTYGVMILCDDEDAQKFVYDRVQRQYGSYEVRLTAV